MRAAQSGLLPKTCAEVGEIRRSALAPENAEVSPGGDSVDGALIDSVI